jgi:hypothetical protein
MAEYPPMRRPSSPLASAHALIASIVSAVLLLAILGVSATASAATYVVNAADDVGGGPCNVTHCNLREALQAAQDNAGPHRIEFNVPGTGRRQLIIDSPLPDITRTVTIDGFTQPGASANTSAGGPINAVINIALIYEGYGTFNLLTVAGGAGSQVTIRGLSLVGWARILLDISSANEGTVTVAGNYIGTVSGSDTSFGNPLTGGIVFNNGTLIVGGTTPDARNVITALDSGITINSFSGAPMTATVQGNLIGPGKSGTASPGSVGTDYGIGAGGPQRHLAQRHRHRPAPVQ